MVNPFAKRILDKQLEADLVREAQGTGIPAMLGAALDSISKMPRKSRQYMARCGGLLKRNSIKQRTRLNRDRRNNRY